ncbi:MAG: Polyribonucleotide nucleotidyltransferase [Candidatus Wolfebacteria bacterium GW2011_GWA2_42_10]|uniref:Polyribonucleotide nucleotidyltransferase n=2 Tax=Candidatus Wolfeibacteriota TaxID=1752735 RepID=A0A0G0ZTL3_9BACT|nr:MAG: Polyribonucleotide nucleotidyltransferase [Candidatus Wolfebacteria bacterium GW2011_GWB1_41_12]KKS25331.1 MAG: Polyribonucleotide nucleotidyltransferase [Candidatus Wolfebacteria bacterium GW2011_GWA2_42_10]KKT56770.1 MAG: Polyribonucleotide nucleotidyltransferase [Candidatus Wolfebacteria bacterium GW2011_GWA1_44_24]
MNFNKQQFSIDFAGQPLTLTVSRLAEQANAAVLGQYGDTSVLVTAVMGNKDKDIDYLPLVVDYEEKFYAAGKIIGSRFIRREGRPSEAAVLSGRLIDRSIRPLFDSRMRRDIQIVVTVLSYDEENDPDFISLLSASAALLISDIPWNGPIAGVRTARIKDGETVINPTNRLFTENKNIVFDAFIAGTENKINMIELSGNEAEEKEAVESFVLAHEEIKKLIEFQKEIVQKIGQKKAEVALIEPPAELREKVVDFLNDKLEQALYVKDKTERQNQIAELKENLKQYLLQESVQGLESADQLFEEKVDKLVHKNIIESEKRPDARKLDEVRELFAEIGLFKRLHGSALFARGNTQALAVTTLAAPGAEQLIETMEISGKRRFMLHYNFPPYSVGEVGRMGGVGRREIGHGNLADKAVRPLIPSSEEFPYTIRVVSEILSSNGSSSMASVSAASMSLMDAGVPIKKAAAGIAMGLMSVPDGRYKILTDIQGPEDHYGDMDCKIAGTSDGITAIQMDVKIEGVTPKILEEVLMQSKKARLEILEFMKKTIDKPRAQISSFAPVIMTLEIKPEQIGEVIGPGGKVINAIIKDTGVETIDIEESGRVFVAGMAEEKVISAIRYIKSLTRQFQIGEILEGSVIKILEFGAIVDLGGGKDGMVHVSELKEGFVKKVEDVIKIGDIVKVKVIKVENGKIGLSIKALSK